MADNEDKVTIKLDALHDRLNSMEAALSKLTDAVVQIARMEVRQQAHTEAVERAFSEITKIGERLAKHEEIADARFEALKSRVPENLSTRLTALEEAAPVSKLVHGWILSWVAGIVGIVGGAVATKILWP